MDAETKTEPSEPIGTLFQRLIGDGKTYAVAQVSVVRAQVMAKVADVRSIAIFGVAALAIANAALVALLVGLIMAIAVSLGPLWATLIVVLGALALAGLLAWLAMQQVKKMSAGGAGA